MCFSSGLQRCQGTGPCGRQAIISHISSLNNPSPRVGIHISIFVVGPEVTKVEKHCLGGPERHGKDGKSDRALLWQPDPLSRCCSLSLELPAGALSPFSSSGAGPVSQPAQPLQQGAAGAVLFAPHLPRASPCWRFSVNPAAAGGEIPGSFCVPTLSATEPEEGKGHRK